MPAAMARATRRAALVGFGLGAAGAALAQTPILPGPELLAAGGFAWQPETAPAGPVLVLVSLTEQVARVYRNGIEIGIARVSTGRPGYPTPTGVFTILQKARVHHSSTYDEASMPYTERLTWDGVALHAGGVPGYPSSHGCVHLPLEFAELVFGVTAVGGTVVIADQAQAPADLVHPGLMQPTTELPAGSGDFEWSPERAPSGPLSLLVSIADGCKCPDLGIFGVFRRLLELLHVFLVVANHVFHVFPVKLRPGKLAQVFQLFLIALGQLIRQRGAFAGDDLL